MKKHISKINNKKGVSILLALLIMLMCAFAGATAITMAATNIGRYAHENDDTQAYFSVTSAATLIRDTFDDLVYTSRTYDYTVEHTILYDDVNHTESYIYSLPKNETATGTIMSTATDKDGNNLSHTLTGKKLATHLISALDKVVPFKSIPDEWYNNVKISDPDNTAGNLEKPTKVDTLAHPFDIVSNNLSIGTIKATLITNDNYDLMFSFVYQTSNNIDLYAVTLYMEATTEILTDTDIKTNGTTDKEYSEKNITKRSVRVTWQAKNATISRGDTTIA